jgi:uncharacterized protein YdeI (YjbR/CyaY-like superfamily)
LPIMPPKPKSFTAVLEPLGNGLGWVIARVPFDVKKAWPVRRALHVRGEIARFQFRSVLFGFSDGGGHYLLVNKKMQAAAKAKVGSMVRITLEPDMEERETIVPPELTRALKGDRSLKLYFEKLSPSMRRFIGDLISEPKGAASRVKRAEKITEMLLLAMEGEDEPPPVLRAAFLRQPLAETGWKALTPTQRRNHLLGIFYYESTEARERRAAKAVEDALRAARRKSTARGKKSPGM